MYNVSHNASAQIRMSWGPIFKLPHVKHIIETVCESLNKEADKPVKTHTSTSEIRVRCQNSNASTCICLRPT